ncbi:MAG: hypothetical protein QM296_04920 [Bacillota bacterium]|nr:hypothetical protein [Bacillota bacterium]
MTKSQPASAAVPSKTIVRSARRQKLYLIVALLLIAIAVVLVPVGQMLRGRDVESPQKPPYRGNLLLQKDEEVEVQLVWFEQAMGSIGDEFYHLARDQRHNFFVLVVNGADSKDLEARLESDPQLAALEREPLSLIGTIKELDPDPGYAAIVRFTHYGIGDGEPMSPLDVRVNYGIFKVYTSETSETSERIWITAVVVGFFGLICLLVAWGERRGHKKALALLNARRPGWAERGLLDVEADFASKDLGLRVVDDLLIAESGSFNVADLREVRWIYLNSTRIRQTTSYALLLHNEAGEKTVLSLPSKKRVIEREMPRFWAYIEQTYPELRIGNTMENRQPESGQRLGG